MGLDTVLTDLESEGYATRTFIIPACAVGAPHKRDRLWIISHTDRRVGDVSDSEYDGRIASEKPRGVKEAVRQESEGENYSLDFEGAGGLSRAESFVADTHNEGVRSWERGSVSESLQEDDGGGYNQERVGDYDGNQNGEPQIICENEEIVADSDSSGQRQGDKKVEGRSSEQLNGSGVQSRPIVDNSNGKGLEGVNDDTKSSRGVQQKFGKRCKVVADSSGSEQQGGGKGSFHGERPVSRELRRSRENSQGRWAVEPSVGRVAHGVPGRVDRLRGLGNAIVPQISYKIGVCIKEMANERS